MLDFGWPELLIIVAIAVFVIGPDDIPNIMYALGRFFRRFQYVRYAISQQFDDVLKSGDIEELRRGVNFEAPEMDGVKVESEDKEKEPQINTDEYR